MRDTPQALPIYRPTSGIPWMCEPRALAHARTSDLRPYIGLIPGQSPALPPAYPDPSKRGPGYDLNNGVATIPVHGVIYRHSTYLDDLYAWAFGGVSLDTLADAFRAALADPLARAILFSFDSPGGEAAGVGELAARIRSGASAKPVAAYVEASCCSAAYYLAAACGEITAAPGAYVGSVGVVIPLVDDSGYQEMIGIVDNPVVSEQSPNKWPDATTPEGKAPYQAFANSLAKVFISDVAAYRNTTVESVLSDFGQGWIKTAADAKKAGMIDKVGDLESTLKKLSGQNRLRLATHKPAAEAPRKFRVVRSA